MAMGYIKLLTNKNGQAYFLVSMAFLLNNFSQVYMYENF